MMMPITSTNEKPSSVSPPSSHRQKTEMNVRPEVMMVRDSVWLMDLLMMVRNVSARLSLKDAIQV